VKYANWTVIGTEGHISRVRCDCGYTGGYAAIALSAPNPPPCPSCKYRGRNVGLQPQSRIDPDQRKPSPFRARPVRRSKREPSFSILCACGVAKSFMEATPYAYRLALCNCPPRDKYLPGDRYGPLTIVCTAKSVARDLHVAVRCDCGTLRVIRTTNLKRHRSTCTCQHIAVTNVLLRSP
jgi:hypothetical protein